MNKRQKQILDRYRESNMFNLYDAYSTFSRAKSTAWERCREIAYDTSKENVISPLKILGANSFQFSAGFTYTTPELNTFMVYITANGTEEFEITED